MAKRVLAWCLAIGAGAALLILLVTPKPLPVQSFQMPDGRQISLLTVTEVTNPTVVIGKPLARLWYAVLPGKYKKHSPANAVTYPSQPNVPAFWFFEAKPILPGPILPVRAIDEFGCERLEVIPENRTEMSISSAHSFVKVYYCQAMCVFPRGKTAGLAIYDSEAKTNKVATVFIPGNVPKKLPEWTPPSTATAEQAGMKFELREFVTGLQSEPFEWAFKITNGFQFTHFSFHITKSGASAPDWHFASIEEMRDASGNELRTFTRKQTVGTKDGDSVLYLQGTLDPASGPWKMKMKFANESTNQVVEFVANPVLVHSGKE